MRKIPYIILLVIIMIIGIWYYTQPCSAGSGCLWKQTCYDHDICGYGCVCVADPDSPSGMVGICMPSVLVR